MSEELGKIDQLQRKLDGQKFAQYFYDLKDEVRRSLRLGDYQTLFKSYRELLRLLDDFKEAFIDSLYIFIFIFKFSDCQSQRHYGLKLDSLNTFLSRELRNALLNLYTRVHFPFKDASDPYTYEAELIKSTDILKVFDSYKPLNLIFFAHCVYCIVLKI